MPASLRFSALTFCFLLFLTALSAQRPLPRRTVLPDEFREISSMARSSSGDLWLLNDSPHPPVLYRYDLCRNKVVETRPLPVPNRDWEELAIDGEDNLYIGDFGNNFNARRDLRIYRYHPGTGRLDSILFEYPDQTAFPPADRSARTFDCEAMVFFRDSLHLFSKNTFGNTDITKHYVLPARPGRYRAELRDSLYLKKRVISGAGISRDGRTLALVGYHLGKRLGFIPYAQASVFYFTGFRGSNFLRGKMERRRLPKFLVARQFESIAEWGGECWVAANEWTRLHKPGVWRVKR
jgi:hypothetical protein